MTPGSSGRSASTLADHIVPAAITGAFLLLRASIPPRGLDEIGLVAIRDAVLSLTFSALIILVGMGLGEAILDRLRPAGLTRLESTLFGFGLGMGALSLLVTALGLIGLLSRAWISAIVIGAALVAGPRMVRLSRGAVPTLKAIAAKWRPASPLAKTAMVLAAVIGLLAIAQALTPPWDYDGLMYHLVGPRMFLQAGRIFPYPDNWYINGPFSIEMLFSIGMAFGDDVFTKLIHLSYSFVLLTATYAAGRRWLPDGLAWLGPTILLTVPALPIFSAFAYIDLAWSAYEFLALMAVLLWWESRSSRSLVVGGLMIGWAAGSKYIGLEGFALLGLLILIGSRKQGLPGAVRSGLIFGLPAVAIALPWYVKNLAWFGNPVFPLYFGGPGWDPTRLALYSAYLDSFGVGHTLVEDILLPLNIYTRHVSFGAVMNRIDIPSLLFPLVLAYPFTRKGKALSILLAIAAARFVFWAAGSQQTRFLFPIYPNLALVAAHVIDRIRLGGGGGRLLRTAAQSLAVGMLVIPLFYESLILIQSSGIGTIVGATSKRAFLDANVTGFRAFETAPLTEIEGRVLLLGDGRDYYCSPMCIPDPDHFRWASDVEGLTTCTAVRDWMRNLNVRAIMLNLEDIDFLLQHDPVGAMSTAIQRIQSLNAAGCLQPVYEENLIRVYSLAE